MVEAGYWRLSDHCRERMLERGISLQQVMEAIGGGIIVQEFPNRAPNPECIIRGDVERSIGFLTVIHPLYVVCAIGEKVTFVSADWNPPREFGQKRERRRR